MLGRQRQRLQIVPFQISSFRVGYFLWKTQVSRSGVISQTFTQRSQESKGWQRRGRTLPPRPAQLPAISLLLFRLATVNWHLALCRCQLLTSTRRSFRVEASSYPEVRNDAGHQVFLLADRQTLFVCVISLFLGVLLIILCRKYIPRRFFISTRCRYLCMLSQ